MARKLYIRYLRAICVVNRGDRREAIFLSELIVRFYPARAFRKFHL